MWFRRKRKCDDEAKPAVPAATEAAVLAESAVILEGRAAVLYLREGRTPPAWAWLNLVAYSPPGRLKTIAYLAHHATADPWGRAVATIADDLVAVSDSRIERAQRHLLRGLARAELYQPGLLGRASETVAAVHRQLASLPSQPPAEPP